MNFGMGAMKRMRKIIATGSYPFENEFVDEFKTTTLTPSQMNNQKRHECTNQLQTELQSTNQERAESMYCIGQQHHLQ